MLIAHALSSFARSNCSRSPPVFAASGARSVSGGPQRQAPLGSEEGRTLSHIRASALAWLWDDVYEHPGNGVARTQACADTRDDRQCGTRAFREERLPGDDARSDRRCGRDRAKHPPRLLPRQGGHPLQRPRRGPRKRREIADPRATRRRNIGRSTARMDHRHRPRSSSEPTARHSSVKAKSSAATKHSSLHDDCDTRYLKIPSPKSRRRLRSIGRRPAPPSHRLGRHEHLRHSLAVVVHASHRRATHSPQALRPGRHVRHTPHRRGRRRAKDDPKPLSVLRGTPGRGPALARTRMSAFPLAPREAVSLSLEDTLVARSHTH